MYRSWPLQILSQQDRDELRSAARSLLPLAKIDELPSELQGFCSYTLIVSSALDHDAKAKYIIQFRCPKYAIDPQTTAGARNVYGSYAPQVLMFAELTFVNLGPVQATLSRIVPGVMYSAARCKIHVLDGMHFRHQKRYIASFADFLARSWPTRSDQPRKPRCAGKVGANIARKLRLLSECLPSAHLRTLAKTTYDRVHLLDALPVVLTHGDIIPSNVMINAATQSIEALIDWAEAEHLPFGICLYGLEHFLGYETDDQTDFIYYKSAAELRHHFWEELSTRIGLMKLDSRMHNITLFARDVGVFLWYGFAWDGGAIDRVVNERDDPKEMMYLRTFLGLRREAAARL